MVITKIKVLAAQGDATITIKGKLEKRHGKNKWVTRTCKVGIGHASESVDDFHFGEFAVGLNLDEQNSIEGGVEVPIVITCRKAEKPAELWGHGFNVSHDDVKELDVMRGSVTFSWK